MLRVGSQPGVLGAQRFLELGLCPRDLGNHREGVRHLIIFTPKVDELIVSTSKVDEFAPNGSFALRLIIFTLKVDDLEVGLGPRDLGDHREGVRHLAWGLEFWRGVGAFTGP